MGLFVVLMLWFIEASLGELLLQLVFFHKNSRQEIALSALIGQVRVSNLRRVAFIFYWPIVRIYNVFSI